ncbi:root hair defective 3 GTP-binding protein-domain-containing protein [Thamnocephalis sphaerospora]|uniref:Root hair defective 3 GTP-binding protein-domain-containing protein n=1 Tax=Thamnocephalis sphaerospora TaxID=78915 RepID=A0A4P9XM51_9FUNG|nr:root hair defective 3 GTP-binding protein-domain-containing protein [Thamnocephalis sphaerospora]|eukprot:RKP06330.1 root hair defective 3 GTP-binding protein-domain-containing protein [Thamnocephalis sphaerospora]
MSTAKSVSGIGSPAAVNMMAGWIQMLGHDNCFAWGMQERANAKWCLDSWGADYHAVAIVGPRSSEKSMLMNDLFGTEFPVPGCYDAKPNPKDIRISKVCNANVLVMDAEVLHYSSPENDAATCNTAFVAATASALIIDLREDMIDEKCDAIMNLLRGIFSAHLEIFDRRHKTLLLFIVSDHTGREIPEDLYRKLVINMKLDWIELTKLRDVRRCSLEDCFDYELIALPSKHYPERFSAAVSQLYAL